MSDETRDEPRNADRPAAGGPAPAPDGVVETPSPAATSAVNKQQLRQRIVEALKTVYDPEIPVDIYELGLIYNIDVRDDHSVVVEMTLTAPACPAAGILPGEVETKVREVEGVQDSRVELVWEPPWSPDLMSEAARLQLGML